MNFAQAAVIQPLEVRAREHVGQRSMEAFAIVEQQDAMGAEARGEINVVQNKNVQVVRPVCAASHPRISAR